MWACLQSSLPIRIARAGCCVEVVVISGCSLSGLLQPRRDAQVLRLDCPNVAYSPIYSNVAVDCCMQMLWFSVVYMQLLRISFLSLSTQLWIYKIFWEVGLKLSSEALSYQDEVHTCMYLCIVYTQLWYLHEKDPLPRLDNSINILLNVT